MCKYSTTYLHIFYHGCSVFLKIVFSSFLVMEISVEGILLARVYAIMHSWRYLFSSLVMIFLTHCVLSMLNVVLAEGCGPQIFTLRELIVFSTANALTLLYDAAIFVATACYTWSLVKLKRPLSNMTSGPWLLSLILTQGVFRFLTIFSWTLQTTIYDNLIRRNIKGLTSLIERPVSALLVLRFFLDLRDRNAHPNGTSQTRDLATFSSFKAAARNISDAVVEDLRDPEDDACVASQAICDGSVASRA